MILRDALDTRRGTAQRNKIYKGKYKVWDRNKKVLEGYCKQGVLPSEYQQVEYIESNGTQYIDTELYPNPTHKIIVDFQYTDATTAQQRVFGTRNTERGGLCIGMYINAATPQRFAWACADDAGNWQGTSISPDTNKHQFKMDILNGKVAIDDTEFTMSTTRTNTSLTHLLYFAYFSGSASTQPNENKAKGKFFSSQIYENEVLVRNFIPCYRKSDNVIGLYDTVNNVFYTNAGTGTFLKGNDVPNPDYPQEIEVMQGRQVVPIQKNLFNTVMEIGTFYPDGTNNDLVDYRIRSKGYIKVKPNTQYTISMVNNTNKLLKTNTSFYTVNDYTTPRIDKTEWRTTTKHTFITPSNCNYIRFLVSYVDDSTISSPDIVSDIQVTEEYTVDLKSKNKLDTSVEDTTIGGVSVTYDKKTGILTFNGTATSTENRNVKNGDVVKLLSGANVVSLRVVSGSYIYNSSNPESSSIQLWRKWDKSFQIFFSNINNDFFSFSRVLTEDITYNTLQYKICEGDVFNNFKVQVQLEEGSEATDYEPYYDYKLAGIGDYKDNFYTDKGKWYFKELIFKLKLNKDDNWLKSSNKFPTFYVRVQNPKYVALVEKGVCNYFIGEKTVWDKDIVAWDVGDGWNIRFDLGKNTSITTVELWKEYLNSKELICYYVLQTPTIEEITAPTLINQLNALYQAM